MKNNSEGQAQHPETMESHFQASSPNQTNGHLDKDKSGRYCLHCKASEPANVSSGPDWSQCDGCALQAHLRCLTRHSLQINRPDPADNQQHANQTTNGDLNVLLCGACIASRQVTDRGPQRETPAESHACFLCHESDSLGSLHDLRSFLKTKNTTNQSASIVEQETFPTSYFHQAFLKNVSELLESSTSADLLWLHSLHLHISCMERTLSTQWLHDQLVEAGQPHTARLLVLARDQNFWYQMAQDQLPVVSSAASRNRVSPTQQGQNQISSSKVQSCEECRKPILSEDREYFEQLVQTVSVGENLPMQTKQDSLGEMKVGDQIKEIVKSQTQIRSHLLCKQCDMQKVEKQQQDIKRQTRISDLFTRNSIPEPTVANPSLPDQQDKAQPEPLPQPEAQNRIVHKLAAPTTSKKSNSIQINHLVQQAQKTNSESQQQTLLAQGTLAPLDSSQQNQPTGVEIGKRQRRPPMKMLDAEESSSISIKLNQNQLSKRQRTERGRPENGQTQLGQFTEGQQSTLAADGGLTIKHHIAQMKPDPKQSAAAQEGAGLSANDKKLMSQDPFTNPFCNEIFKPIIAADKLQVLRRANEGYDVLILSKDLKVYSKDKRDQFLLNYDETEDLALIEADAAAEEADENGELTESRGQTQHSSAGEEGRDSQQAKVPKPKRRKRASNLSRQANRRTTPGAELSWINNLAKNRKIYDEIQAKQVKPKRSSRKSHSSRATSQHTNEMTKSEQAIKMQDESQIERQTVDQDSLINMLKQEITSKTAEGDGQAQQAPSNDVEMQQENVNHDGNETQTIKAESSHQINVTSLVKADGDMEMKQGPGEATDPTFQQSRLSMADPTNKIDMDEPGLLGQAVKEGMGDEAFKFTARVQITSIDILLYRYNMGYYHKLESLQADFSFLITRAIEQRCKNKLAKDYLNEVLAKSMQHLDRKKNDFNNKWRDYFNFKFRENQMNPRFEHEWSKFAGAKRQYSIVDDYQVVTQADMGHLKAKVDQEKLEVSPEVINSPEYKEVRRKMTTTKSNQCGSDCACQDSNQELRLKLSQTEINPPSAAIEDKIELKNSQGASNGNLTEVKKEQPDCCFHRKVECGKDCGCDPKKCRNRQMSLRQQLILSEDVLEHTAWGMDMYTAFNLCALRPRDIPAMQFSEFLEHRMMFAVQQQGEEGYDIRKALEFIIGSDPTYPGDAEIGEDHLTLWTEKEDPLFFSYMEKELAKIILEAISQIKGQNDPHFRMHSKGLGIFCNRREGIRKNSLLVEYFGEIYPQWLWFEKQDVLKQGQVKGQLSKDLPDFYNITYERHFDDPEGYDILTVDPILFGNFASRLSHSCNPNCETITKVKQDEQMYSIGMFTQKNIKYGAELCFNYCSFTESEEEYRTAACLCGSTICQGRFLNLAIAQKNQGLQKEYHTFIDRNLILYNAVAACSPGGEGITTEDQERLDKFGIKDSVLLGIPLWLKKWASLICEFIEFEQATYPNTQECKLSQEYVSIELKNLRDSKLANIAITINKVSRILKLMGTDLPPIRKMTDREVYEGLWTANDSLKDQLLEVLKNIEDTPEVTNCLELIQTTNLEEDDDKEKKQEEDGPDEKMIDASQDERKYTDRVRQVRCILHFISQTLRGLESRRVAISSLCDNLVCYAKTETYFTPNDYQKCTGNEVHIRKCDVAGQASDQSSLELAIKDQGKTVYKGTKEYQAHHIWGQLVGWYKQTVDKPNSSLSADRRGSLSMPDISSFLISAKNQENLTSGRQTARKGNSRSRRGGRRQDSDDFEEEVMPTQKSRRRGGADTSQQPNGNTSLESRRQNNNGSYDDTGLYVVPEHKPIKVIYPHKKYQTREQFLEHWETFYDKHFDTCCHWSFKNKHKLYGSIGFESVLKAGKDRTKRLDYFREIVEELKGYQ